MAKAKASPVPFALPPLPLIPGGNDVYVQKSLQAIKTALNSTQQLTTYAATVAPKSPWDGMVRLARYPWWPVSGQASDAWVYYDAVGGVWRFTSTAPTSSH